MEYKPNALFPNAIWFQKKDNLRAHVEVVSNQYRFSIFSLYSDGHVGELVHVGKKDTLSLAMREVLKYYGEAV